MRSPRPPLPVLVAIAVLVALALARSGEIRERAEAGLGRGMPAREAELARGFVLGEDEGIDARTEEDFRRAGLSHLLAVSGENVTLLALLAMPLLGALGISLRERLVWVLGLIAIYVPLAGAGPSIQRAAVMGAAGLLATLAGRRASRLYALLLALGVTLAVDPGVAADVGWQLSFAAVAGIFVLASPLREAIAARIGAGGWRRALAEGAAVTIAATLATAPLIAYHFETLSTTTLVANLAAMPAVAPAMWLGMVDGGGRADPGSAAGAAQRRQRPAARLHRPGRCLVRASGMGRDPRPARRYGAGRVLPGPGDGGRARLSPRCAGAGWRRRGGGVLLRCRRRGRFVRGAGLGWRWAFWACSSWPRRSSPRMAGPVPPRRRLGCGSRSSTSARATRSSSSRPTLPRSWSTAGRRETGSKRSWRMPASSAWARR